jgi:glycosyltransferase involved in cell wall biosynthesis
MTENLPVFVKSINDKIKITIGICVKNEERSIKSTLESIKSQDFLHRLMEIIIVDDGSEDKTLQIVLDIAQKMDFNIKVFHEDWKGVGSARNKVVCNALGDYILWVDAGAILPPDFVRKQIKFMDQHPEVGIAKARCVAIEEENILSTLENLQYIAYDSRYLGKVNSFVLGTCGAIYRTDAIKKVGGFDGIFRRSGEDFDIECKVREKGWSLYRNTAVFYREHLRTLKSLWRDGFKHGYGGRLLFSKYGGNILRERLKTAIFDGLINAKVAYTLTRRKIAFLLILHHAFKKFAWFLGFFISKTKTAKSL